MSENTILVAVTNNIPTFKSSKLNEATGEIAGLIDATRANAQENHIKISKILAKVSAEKAYEEDGFKSAVEYAMATFGWKRANAYAMMQVGTKLNAGELPEGNFSVSQYREMLPLSKEEANEAVENGVISADMTAKDIRDEVEVIKPKKERKAKPEKVYIWYLDAIPGRNDITAPESVMANGEGCDGVQKANISINTGDAEVKVIGYLVAKEGQIRFYARGEEVKPEVDGEVVSEQAGE